MTFFTILEVTEISCSLKLVLEGKTGKSSRLELLSFFFQQTILLYQMQKTTPPAH